MYASFFATHCRENAAIRAHAYYIDFGSEIVESISSFIVKDQKAFYNSPYYSESALNIIGCHVPILAQGNIEYIDLSLT